MIVIAHATHWALGLFEATPLLLVAAFAVWKTRVARNETRCAAVTTDRGGATGSHP